MRAQCATRISDDLEGKSCIDLFQPYGHELLDTNARHFVHWMVFKTYVLHKRNRPTTCLIQHCVCVCVCVCLVSRRLLHALRRICPYIDAMRITGTFALGLHPSNQVKVAALSLLQPNSRLLLTCHLTCIAQGLCSTYRRQ
jgi:hypothetical protein